MGKVESEECAYSWESLCRLIETRRLMFSSPLCSLLLQFPLFFFLSSPLRWNICVACSYRVGDFQFLGRAIHTSLSRSSLECYISNLFFFSSASDRDDTRRRGDSLRRGGELRGWRQPGDDGEKGEEGKKHNTTRDVCEVDEWKMQPILISC